MKIYDYRYGETTLEVFKNSEDQIEITYTSENEIHTFTLETEDEMKLLKFLVKA